MGATKARYFRFIWFSSWELGGFWLGGPAQTVGGSRDEGGVGLTGRRMGEAGSCTHS